MTPAHERYRLLFCRPCFAHHFSLTAFFVLSISSHSQPSNSFTWRQSAVTSNAPSLITFTSAVTTRSASSLANLKSSCAKKHRRNLAESSASLLGALFFYQKGEKYGTGCYASQVSQVDRALTVDQPYKYRNKKVERQSPPLCLL